MAERPTWRGHLRLALVSCPIRLLPATTQKETIRFNKLNRATGHRLRQQMIDAETEEVVARDDAILGYEYRKGDYVKVEPDELDKLKIDSSETVAIERIVALDAVDCLYWDTPYLVEPDGEREMDIFATLRDALAENHLAGIGRTVLARRERPVALMARGRGMLLITLRDPDEIRQPEEVFADLPNVKAAPESLALAVTLIERMRGKFDLSYFQDRYQDALRDLIQAKLKGKRPVPVKEPERPSNVVNLFDALKASLRATERSGAAKAGNRSVAAAVRGGKASARAAPRRRRG